MSQILSIENVSKRYRLGTIASGTASEDLKRWWTMRILKRPDPLASVGPQADHGNRDGEFLWALRDVSFTVDEGEVVGIIGKNGAGKSTLLKILSQITAPTSGAIRYRGRLASLLEVGTGFNGELTGRDNIYLNGGILGMTPREVRKQFDEIVEFSEIGEFIDTPVKRYSSGMFVRLAFSVAAHLETDIMVIDEVLAVGDIGFQKKCLSKISEASSYGRTVLFVSHRMDHIKNLCPRSVVLDRGLKVFDGETQQAIQNYYGIIEAENNEKREWRRAREASGDLTINDIHIENSTGRRANIFMSSEDVEFVMSVTNETGETIKNLKVSIFVYTAEGAHLSDIGTWESGHPPFEVHESAVIRVKVPKLPFNKGLYYYSCVIRRAGGAYEIDDMIENAGNFTVDHGDFHGIGQAVGGIVSIPHHCSVIPPE